MNLNLAPTFPALPGELFCLRSRKQDPDSQSQKRRLTPEAGLLEGVWESRPGEWPLGGKKVIGPVREGEQARLAFAELPRLLLFCLFLPHPLPSPIFPA